jgi:hypothetical protein
VAPEFSFLLSPDKQPTFDPDSGPIPLDPGRFGQGNLVGPTLDPPASRHTIKRGQKPRIRRELYLATFPRT